MRKLFFISAAIITSVIVMQQGEFVLAPLALALLFSISISPVVGYLEGKKWHTGLASILVTILLFVVLIGLVSVISNQYYKMVEGLPMLGPKMNDLFHNVCGVASGALGIEEEKLVQGISEYTSKLQSAMTGILESVWKSVSSFISFLVMLPVFTVLILINRQKIKQFVYDLPSNGEDTSWEETANQIKHVVRRYILGLLIVIVILGILNTAGLLIFGIPFAFALGLSSATLSVIPYLGNLLGGGLAVLVAYATKDNPYIAMGVLIMYVVIQFLEGNVITPKVLGNQVGVNSIVVIVALLIGGFVWGVMGMILAVPIAAVIKVVLARSKTSRPFAGLMGE